MSTLDLTLIVIAYLLGSISSAIIVCRLMGLPDPRTQGSNNPGATNVLRIGGKKAAAITLFGDSLKGLLHLCGVEPFGGAENQKDPMGPADRPPVRRPADLQGSRGCPGVTDTFTDWQCN